MKNFEQELKMSLTEREYGILLSQTDAQPVLQTNYYFQPKFYSPDVMVRLRKKQGYYVLCYKQRLSNSNGITVCDERECQIANDFADSFFKRGIRPDEINDMLGTDFDCALYFVGQMDTYRCAFAMENWQLELDKSHYLGVTDFELECEHNDANYLAMLPKYLEHNFGVQFRQSTPKVQRFMQALKAKNKG